MTALASTRRPHRASQASIGLVVVGLHLFGVLVWWTAERGMHWVRSDEQRLATIAVWLPTLAAIDTKHKKPVAPRQRDNSPAEPRHTQNSTTTSASTGISAPALTEQNGSVAVQSSPQTQTEPPLNLNLSRKAIASVAPPSFAERSPFRGRLPVTVERLIASAAAETGAWTEERLDNDHIRFRRGNTCVTMQRPRAASIDPFSEAAARIPWRTSGEEQCQ